MNLEEFIREHRIIVAAGCVAAAVVIMSGLAAAGYYFFGDKKIGLSEQEEMRFNRELTELCLKQQKKYKTEQVHAYQR